MGYPMTTNAKPILTKLIQSSKASDFITETVLALEPKSANAAVASIEAFVQQTRDKDVVLIAIRKPAT